MDYVHVSRRDIKPGQKDHEGLQHLSHGDDPRSARGRVVTASDDLILARLENIVVVLEESFIRVLLQDPRDLRTSREDSSDALLEQHSFDDLLHLRWISWEVHVRRSVHETVVEHHSADTEVAGVVGHLVDTGMTEVAEQVAVVESCHGKLGKGHLQESREGGEDTSLVGIETEASGGGQVSAFLDAHHA